MEEEDGRRRDGRRGRAGRAATRARAAVAMGGEGRGGWLAATGGAEAVVKWRQERFGTGWGFDEGPGRREIFAAFERVDTQMGRPLACASSYWRPR